MLIQGWIEFFLIRMISLNEFESYSVELIWNWLDTIDRKRKKNEILMWIISAEDRPVSDFRVTSFLRKRNKENLFLILEFSFFRRRHGNGRADFDGWLLVTGWAVTYHLFAGEGNRKTRHPHWLIPHSANPVLSIYHHHFISEWSHWQFPSITVRKHYVGSPSEASFDA